jgi:hypothetical protein
MSGHHLYKGYVKKLFPPQLERLASVTTQSIRPASKIAGRGLVNLLLLDILETDV